ncbi:nucleotidyl transferase AbiEii/AbiGii toxin family protein [Patescibacteria group bacterium]|nr:nucleotidyl transferase AbiEii/AbiGii toxin family protein [Patescibacteria group bacterium]
MLIQNLEKKVQELKNKGLTNGVVKNYLKEYFQLFILEFFYNQKKYQDLIFTGGSCLRFCYGLNRLSEDLDLDSLKKIDKKELVKKIKEYFKKNLQYKDLEISIKGKGEKIYLKFPILKILKLSKLGETDKLYVKIEIEKVYKTPFGLEKTPILQDGFSFFVKNYDLPSLMAGKINAILFRIFFKGKEDKIIFKGRDWYDLIWYFRKGIKPNSAYLKKLTKISDEKEIFKKLDEKAMKLNLSHLKSDIENLFESKKFVEDFAANFRDLYKKLSSYLILA